MRIKRGGVLARNLFVRRNTVSAFRTKRRVRAYANASIGIILYIYNYLIYSHNCSNEKKLFSVTRSSSSEKRERFYSVEIGNCNLNANANANGNVNRQILECRTVLVEPQNIIIDNYNIMQLHPGVLKDIL